MKSNNAIYRKRSLSHCSHMLLWESNENFIALPWSKMCSHPRYLSRVRVTEPWAHATLQMIMSAFVDCLIQKDNVLTLFRVNFSSDFAGCLFMCIAWLRHYPQTVRSTMTRCLVVTFVDSRKVARQFSSIDLLYQCFQKSVLTRPAAKIIDPLICCCWKLLS